MSLINQMLQDLESRGQGTNGPASDRYAQLGGETPASRHLLASPIVLFVAIIFILSVVTFSWKFLFASHSTYTTSSTDARPSSDSVNPKGLANVDQAAFSAHSAIPELKDLPWMLKLARNVDDKVVRNALRTESTMEIRKEPKKEDLRSDGQQGKENNTNVSKTVVGENQNAVVALENQNAQQVPMQSSVQSNRQDDVKSPGRVERSNAASQPAIMIKEVSAQQRAEGEYRRATQYQQQGRVSDAILAFEAALKEEPGHGPARQALVAQFLELNRHDDAIRELKLGLQVNPNELNLVMILARLQVEKAKLSEAIESLQKSLPYAQEKPEYLAFLAALQHKVGHHKDAVQLYKQALRLHAQNAAWWMGLGMALAADGINADAIEALSQAKAQGGLGAELIAFIDKKIAQLQNP